MQNIQLATTLVAPTGTGKLMVPYASDADSATYVESGASGRPSMLTIKRVRPKPNGSFPGTERFEWRLTEYYTVNAIEYTAIAYGGFQIAVPVASSDRTGLFTRAALIARDAIVSDGAATNRIPL